MQFIALYKKYTVKCKGKEAITLQVRLTMKLLSNKSPLNSLK